MLQLKVSHVRGAAESKITDLYNLYGPLQSLWAQDWRKTTLATCNEDLITFSNVFPTILTVANASYLDAEGTIFKSVCQVLVALQGWH